MELCRDVNAGADATRRGEASGIVSEGGIDGVATRTRVAAFGGDGRGTAERVRRGRRTWGGLRRRGFGGRRDSVLVLMGDGVVWWWFCSGFGRELKKGEEC